MLGSHLIKHWATTQNVIALSSGEAELAGIVKGACEGLGLLSVARDLGMETCLEVLADSSAAIGICRRTGIGKVRHLAVGQLWVQERVRGGDFALTKHPGAHNPADIITKAVEGNLIQRHMAAIGARDEQGRAASAPLLIGAGGLGKPACAVECQAGHREDGAPVAGRQLTLGRRGNLARPTP